MIPRTVRGAGMALALAGTAEEGRSDAPRRGSRIAAWQRPAQQRRAA